MSVRLLSLLLLVAVAGCGSTPKPDPEVVELKKQLEALTARVAELEAAPVSTRLNSDPVHDTIFVRDLFVLDAENKPRICLTASMMPQVFYATCNHPSVLIDSVNGINANVTLTNAAGKHVTRLSSYPGGGSGSFSSAKSGIGSLQITSGDSGPELRQYQPDGNWINLKQIPVDNPDTDYR